MPITWLFNEPILFVSWLAAILVALTVHEFSHATVAKFFGDDTAESMGRISLNPFDHVDLLGLAMLVFIGFGWAKPVPVNPNNLKNARVSSALISLAGPLANLISVVAFGFVLAFVGPMLGPANLLVNFLFLLVFINVILMVFNLIPIPPLDGSKVLFALLPDKYDDFKEKLSINGPLILIMLLLVDNFLNLGIFSTLFSGAFNILGRFL